jgi:2-phosphosulfolactate phosphatase
MEKQNGFKTSLAVHVCFSPRDLAGRTPSPSTVFLVLDILRATTTIVTALQNGASRVIAVSEIDDAIKVRGPNVLLAGERGGRRITADMAGGIEFDLGNSPREMTRDKVHGQSLVITTSNGTRAIRRSAELGTVLVVSFRNLTACLERACKGGWTEVVVVCSGAGYGASFEDTLAAGAVCEEMSRTAVKVVLSDSAQIARALYLREAGDLMGAMKRSKNGRRLLSDPQLRGDVAFSLRRDDCALVPVLGSTGEIVASEVHVTAVE